MQKGTIIDYWIRNRNFNHLACRDWLKIQRKAWRIKNKEYKTISDNELDKIILEYTEEFGVDKPKERDNVKTRKEKSREIQIQWRKKLAYDTNGDPIIINNIHLTNIQYLTYKTKQKKLDLAKVNLEQND